MNRYIFDGTFEGLLSCVFAAFTHRERPQQLQRLNGSLTLFGGAEGREIDTVVEHADRVWRALERKLMAGELNAVAASFLCDDENFDSALFRVICRIFDEGAHVIRDFTSPDVLSILQNARRVNYEAHRLRQFMRFQKAADGTYIGIMEPAYDVMPQAVEHFRDRFSDSRFIIYDQRRHYGFLCERGEMLRIRLPLVETLHDGELPAHMTDPEEELFQKLWRTYFKAIAITERRNPRKQKQDMPVRFWKYLTEKKLK